MEFAGPALGVAAAQLAFLRGREDFNGAGGRRRSNERCQRL